MRSEYVELSVAGVALDDNGDSPTVILRDTSSGRFLTVPVGAFEASAIIIEVEGLKPPRPLTHDLFAELFTRHGFRFSSFELYARTDEGFLGRIRYRKGLRSYSMEVRPSDGLALAIRLGASIRSDPELFESLSCGGTDAYPTSPFDGSVLYLDAKACEDAV